MLDELWRAISIAALTERQIANNTDHIAPSLRMPGIAYHQR